ncbi:MAG: LLM class flavin-dependent oxidoreductase [Candidatus Binataceae bacterium]|nr:LLM class flavin-dependent oxidoreductase [Candidatus Binataceae bacterium]
MKFGYFTLSDNRYPANPRTAEQAVVEIYEQSILADKLGMHSAWIGEHHLNYFGVNSSPQVMLAAIAGATRRIRLAPAVVLLPIHHPLHVAEDWATLDLLSGGRVDFAAGRGYDRDEYAAFDAPYDDSAGIFAEAMEVVWRAWTETGRWSHRGKYYQFQNVDIVPKPLQNPMRPYVACFSRPSMELGAANDWHIVYAPFSAAMAYGSLAAGVKAYEEECAKYGRARRRVVCSVYTHLCSAPGDEQYGRERIVSYFKDALLPALPADPEKIPPHYRYFLKIVDAVKNMRAKSFVSSSVLIGPVRKVIDELKAIEASGVDEVVVGFGFGCKPNRMVQDQMTMFMEQVAPAFDA